MSVDAPFAETGEPIAGLMILEVDAMDGAVAWAMAAPPGLLGPGASTSGSARGCSCVEIEARVEPTA